MYTILLILYHYKTCKDLFYAAWTQNNESSLSSQSLNSSL
jgi:hypothetical protein